LEAYLSLALDPGHTALDVGCGPGTDLPALAEAVTVTGSVIGVDLRPTMVAEARRRMADVPWVQVLEGDAAALPLENNRVDRARADRTLQDVEDPASVFAEIHRVLCPGGIAVVADFDWATISIDGDEEAGLAFNEYVITEAVRNAAIGRQLRRLTLGAGLEVVEVRQSPCSSMSSTTPTSC